MGVDVIMSMFRQRETPDEHETHLYTRGCHGSVAECGYELRGTDAACSGCPARKEEPAK